LRDTQVNRLVQEENALSHVIEASKRLLESRDILENAKIRLDDERLALAAPDACPAEQFGSHLVFALKRGTNAG
jgi:hypothetical protein